MLLLDLILSILVIVNMLITSVFLLSIHDVLNSKTALILSVTQLLNLVFVILLIATVLK